jgi:hypothetical protein
MNITQTGLPNIINRRVKPAGSNSDASAKGQRQWMPNNKAFTATLQFSYEKDGRTLEAFMPVPNARSFELLQDVEPSSTARTNPSSGHPGIRDHLRIQAKFLTSCRKLRT